MASRMSRSATASSVSVVVGVGVDVVVDVVVVGIVAVAIESARALSFASSEAATTTAHARYESAAACARCDGRREPLGTRKRARARTRLAAARLLARLLSAEARGDCRLLLHSRPPAARASTSSARVHRRRSPERMRKAQLNGSGARAIRLFCFSTRARARHSTADVHCRCASDQVAV